MNQDFTAWAGQGTVSDRWNEHLGESDRGVILMRKRLMDDLAVVGDGGDPKGVLRDAARNARIPLPRIRAEIGQFAPTKHPPAFPFLAGQPPEVVAEYHALWKAHGGEVPGD